MKGLCLRRNSSRCSISLLSETGSSAEKMSSEGNDSGIKMNALLKQKCSEFNLLYLNLHDAYVNNDGSLIKDLSDGNVHLKTFIYHDKCFEEMITSYTNLLL